MACSYALKVDNLFKIIEDTNSEDSQIQADLFLLMEKNCDILDAENLDGEPVLTVACKKGKLGTVKLLIEQLFVNVYRKGWHNENCFLAAARVGND